jgi:hypothetical protein
MDKVIAHIKKDKCERCLAVYRQLDEESRLIAFLMRADSRQRDVWTGNLASSKPPGKYLKKKN